MNQNTNLPPGYLARDLDGPRDMAAAMDAFFERLDRRVEKRRERIEADEHICDDEHSS